jgi:hydroxyethylthiazole kinase
MTTAHAAWLDLERIRAAAPLVHNITNYVVMNPTANALLALGASPVMAHALEEVEDMVGLAGALVLNIGTLSPAWIEAMSRAGARAVARGIPVVLDPVGAGATAYRTSTAHRLLNDASPAVVRGNASEIRALVDEAHGTKGVDSTDTSEAAAAAAAALALGQRCVVSVSGATDLIVSDTGVIRIGNGHALMPRITGMGCTASAFTGAFAAVNPSPTLAAAHAMLVMGVAGEIAGEQSAGPGSFWTAFLDAVAALSARDLQVRARFS